MAVIQLQDGSFAGVGTDKNIYTSPSLTDCVWTKIDDSCCIVSIEQLSAFEHHGWWQPMDTLRDKRSLQSLWEKGEAPWLMM
jgi:hypothetical protein